MKKYIQLCAVGMVCFTVVPNVLGSASADNMKVVVPVWIERSPSSCCRESSPEIQFDAYQKHVTGLLHTKQESWSGADVRLDLNSSLIKFWRRVESLPIDRRKVLGEMWLDFAKKLGRYDVQQLCVKYTDASDMLYIATLMQALSGTLRRAEIEVSQI